MSVVLPYVISFATLFLAELCSALHSLYASKGYPQRFALCGALSSALWCVKIVVIVGTPATIITAFLGAYLGALAACRIHSC